MRRLGLVRAGTVAGGADRRGKRIERHALALVKRRVRAASVAGGPALGALFAIRTLLALRAGGALGPSPAFRTILAFRAILSVGPGGALRAIVALIAIIALGPVIASADLAARLALLGFELAFAVRFDQFLAVVVAVIVAMLAALLFEADPGFAEHSEIMVRELQIIFGLHAVARKLRIARHVLVLFE